MGYNQSLSAVYSDIWERYKQHCEREGMIALNRFCEGEGIKVRRLYEWLRRRKIKYINNPILVNTLLRTAVPLYYLQGYIQQFHLEWHFRLVPFG